MKTETQTSIPNAILSLFRPTFNEVNDDIDFGGRFLRPPPVSTQNHVIDSSPEAGNQPNRAAASSSINLASLLRTLNLNGSISGFGPSKANNSKVTCSTPLPNDPSQRSNFNNNSSFAFNFPTPSPPPPPSPPALFDSRPIKAGNLLGQYAAKFATKANPINQNSFSSDGQSDEEGLFSLHAAYTGVYMDHILRQAKQHRNAAAHSSANCTWRGQLTTRNHRNAQLSPKVFLGGVPWDVNDASLKAIFSKFGPVQIQWPGREVRCSSRNTPSKCGYVYIVFENQDCVQALLSECTYDSRNGGQWFYTIPTKRMPLKDVQVIPWMLSDSNWVKNPSQRLDPNRTVFVGALHGMITAECLARIMNDLFKDVVYVGIDTDKKKYPLGSARVSFSSTHSYIRAIMAGFVEIKCNKFSKKVRFYLLVLFNGRLFFRSQRLVNDKLSMSNVILMSY